MGGAFPGGDLIENTFVISKADLEAYQRDGVVCLRQMFDQNWLDFLDEAIEEAMGNPGPFAEEYTPKGGTGRFFGDLEMALHRPSFKKFVWESTAAEIASQVMQSERVNFFYDHLLVKEPGTQEQTPWHQDQPYWAVSGLQVCSVWFPLDPVSRESSLEFVAGSHLWPAYSPYHFSDGTPYQGTGLPQLPDIESTREDHRILSFEMLPGDCVVFQGMIVHGAAGNLRRGRRRALSTRWTGDDARYVVRKGEVAIPTEDPGLADGDRLDCDRFPLVWVRSQTTRPSRDA